MPALTTSELERLIIIMRNMQQEASSGNWQELERLDGKRRALLQYDAASGKSYAGSRSGNNDLTGSDVVQINGNPSSTLSDNYRSSLVDEIRTLDKQIIGQVQAVRAKLLNENRGFNAQVKAKKLYAQTNAIT